MRGQLSLVAILAVCGMLDMLPAWSHSNHRHLLQSTALGGRKKLSTSMGDNNAPRPEDSFILSTGSILSTMISPPKVAKKVAAAASHGSAMDEDKRRSMRKDGAARVAEASPEKSSLEVATGKKKAIVTIFSPPTIEPELSAEQLKRRKIALAAVDADADGKSRASVMFSFEAAETKFMDLLRAKKQEAFQERLALLEKQEEELNAAREYELMSITGKKEYDRDEEREDRDMDEGGYDGGMDDVF